MNNLVALIVLDGFAYGKEYEGNAISKANIPNFNRLKEEYPSSILQASGEAVGLPEGQMGNSEVGHLNLGAGRVVYQSLTRINISIRNGEFFKNEAINESIEHARENNKKFHIFGLLSDGGVHSHIDHIIAILKLAKDKGLKDIYVHAFLDGRDVPPKSAIEYVEKLETAMSEIGAGKIATVSGRYYAMDRDKNWERTQKAYDAITEGFGEKYETATAGIEASYDDDVVDEFVIPFVCLDNGTVDDNDSVVFANFRPDRAIQIATAISNPEASGLDYSKGPKNVNFVSMMLYSENVNGKLAFNLQTLNNTFGDYISEKGLKQLRIAETEKYAHVTFFFDGGVDKEIEGAKRVLINSPKVATYDLKPEMSAYEVTDAALKEIESGVHDVMILNFANCDMVGHTGEINATIRAVEAVDQCLGKVVEAITSKGGVALITADHGNAEKLLDDKGKIFTAHTTNPVPLIITKKGINIAAGGKLGDLAPTMLELLDLEQPKEMTGKSIIK